MTMMLAMSLSNQYVHAYLHVPFFIVCFVLYVILMRPAPTNPTRQTWQCLILWVFYWKTPKQFLSIVGCAFEEKRKARGSLSETPKSSPITLRKGFALQ
ncbi:hypothetical protein [Ethanoligenens harbinense]|nr:hypothetical protein [Ethanoligenens harbinense]